MNTIVEERQVGTTGAVAADSPAAAGEAGMAAGMPKEFLIFRLGDEEYGIDIVRVQEIRRDEAPPASRMQRPSARALSICAERSCPSSICG